jgi:hypothetical protein
MAKTPQEMEATMVANFKDNTGKTLEQWLSIAKRSQLVKHGDIVKHLKEQHELTHGYANLVALRALAPAGGAPAGDDLIEAQYAGNKAALRPIYRALAKLVSGFGTDVVLDPKKAYVSLRRNKQFGLIQPSTATRVDLGIQLKGVPPKGRLEASGSFNAMVTHRVRIESIDQVDAELAGWLKQAYTAS